MVAGAMVGFGISLGENLPVNIEDPAFNLDGKRGDRPKFIAQIKEEIHKRQAIGKVWGWKYPQAAEYLQSVREDLVAPGLVIVFRDPVPAAIRATEGIGAQRQIDIDGIREMEKCVTLFDMNLKLAKLWQVPTLLVSYERASQNPLKFIEEFSIFSGMSMPASIDKIISFMRPGEYKNPPYPSR